MLKGSFSKKSWGPIAGVVLGFLAFKIPEWLMIGIKPLLVPLLPVGNTQTLLLYGVFEALTIGVLYLMVTWYYQRFSDIGLGRFKPDYIVKAALAFCAYFVFTFALSKFVEQFLVIPDQAQELGFAGPTSLELVLIFAALVVVVPIAEELLFRGFIFKGVRAAFSFPITALVVSVLFAVAHGQLNVGLDVFALSLVLCYLREKTNSLWPGILLHATKNGVAFFLLFIYNG
ncbi:MAG TPA: type II CAAX endopeptidase family protein [Candidatus Saccharimonadales bacterium]|nr:type II CAAX endopeptidase family protein [Candidatus Saccharimonadales bacterium]